MAYERMAPIYDEFMEEAPYDQWVSLTKTILDRENAPVQDIVDLGCGTGQITTKLAGKGYNMTGVDHSNEMLSQAEQLARDQRLNVHWVCQDLRELEGIENMDAAISYCDVINYITTQDDVRTVFENTAALLKPGGVFIFDVHSMFYVDNQCINQTFADVGEDASYIWFCIEGDVPGEMYHDLTFFTKVGRYYEKFSELHHQRTFPVDIYTDLLKASGFEYCHLYGDFFLKQESVSKTAERLFFVARKKA